MNDIRPPADFQFANLGEMLRERAAGRPDERAFVALGDRGGEAASVTFRELYLRAGALASTLAELARPGERVLIMAPSGIEFPISFFACVLAGLVAVPVVAVPTSVGYGAAFGGLAALLGMLNSCAKGLAVVNIDNGFGAAAFAAAILGTQTRRKNRDGQG